MPFATVPDEFMLANPLKAGGAASTYRPSVAAMLSVARVIVLETDAVQLIGAMSSGPLRLSGGPKLRSGQ